MKIMGVTRRMLTAAAVLLVAAAAAAQECDDFSPCTSNDMCREGVCTGVFQNTSCDDGDPCTINDHCVIDELGIDCRGDDPAPEGTSCAGGCGTCQPLGPFPGAPLLCIGDAAKSGDPCDLGSAVPCVDPVCQIFEGGVALCGVIRSCPDTDGNPCTDACNLETGQCDSGVGPPCHPICETCDESTGKCVPANEGTSCDDSNICTAQSRCEAVQLGDEMFGFCLEGQGTGPTPTPTVGPGGDCVGDCDDSGDVAINELIIGVNISLGTADIGQCLAFDNNDSGEVEINELIGGVNSSLAGCA